MSQWSFVDVHHAPLNSAAQSHDYIGSTHQWANQPTRQPSLFYQDQQQNDELFYNTFPAAREALAPTGFVFARNTHEFEPIHNLHPINIRAPDVGLKFKSYTLLSPLEGRFSPQPFKTEPSDEYPSLPSPTEQTTFAPQSAYGSPTDPEPVMDFLESPDYQPHSRLSSSGPQPKRSESSESAPVKYLNERRGLHASQKRGKRKIAPMQSPATGDLPKDKPRLACFFCRGRKIACGPPDPDSLDQTCNQCARRSLCCKYPEESRRGIRKTKAEKEKEKQLLSAGGASLQL